MCRLRWKPLTFETNWLPPFLVRWEQLASGAGPIMKNAIDTVSNGHMIAFLIEGIDRIATLLPFVQVRSGRPVYVRHSGGPKVPWDQRHRQAIKRDGPSGALIKPVNLLKREVTFVACRAHPR